MTKASTSWTSHRWLVLVFAVALLVRGLLFAVGPWRDFNRALHPDSKRYLVLAENLREYGTFGKREEDGVAHRATLQLRALSGTLPQADSKGLKSEVFRTPGYPAFIAAVRTGVRDPRGILIAQCLLGALTAAAIPVIAAAFGLSAIVAIIAGFLWALHPALVLYDNAILTESLFTASLAASCIAAIVTRSNGGSALAGGILGFAALVRPVGLFYLPLPMILTWTRPRSRIIGVGLVLATAVGPSLLWAARNQAAGEGFRVSTVPDHNLLFYTASYVLAEQRGEDWLASWIPHVHELTARLANRIRPGTDVVAAERQLAMDEITARPILFARVTAKSALKLTIDHSMAEAAATLGLPYERSGLFSRFVLGERTGSSGGRSLTAVLALGWMALNVCIGVAASVGFLRACRCRAWPLMACGVTIALGVLSTGSVGLERFRIPMMLPLLILAGYALEQVFKARGSAPMSKSIVPPLTLAAPIARGETIVRHDALNSIVTP